MGFGINAARAKVDDGVMSDGNKSTPPLAGDKTNPPYPPLSGGQKKKTPLTGGREKTKAPLPAAGAAFSYPPDKGG